MGNNNQETFNGQSPEVEEQATTGTTMEWIAVSTFCKVVSAEYAEWDLNEGDEVYLCGDGYVPESEDDPYLVRKFYVAAFMKDDHVQVNEKPLMVMGNHLELLEEGRQNELKAIFVADFSKEEVAEAKVVGYEVPLLDS